MASKQDEPSAAVHIFTGAEGSAMLDFSAAGTNQSITLTAGKSYQVVYDAPNGFCVGKLGSATAALTSALSTQCICSPGFSPVIEGGAWQFYAQKGAGYLLFTEVKA